MMTLLKQTENNLAIIFNDPTKLSVEQAIRPRSLREKLKLQVWRKQVECARTCLAILVSKRHSKRSKQNQAFLD